MTDNLSERIESYLDRNWDDVLADIASLVEIPSTEDLAAAKGNAPFGPGPRRALDKVLEIAERMGLETHDCEGYLGYADLTGQTPRQIGVIGHVDVVPAGPGWTFPPYALTRKDGYLLGRGVIDDKGPLMVAVHAVKFVKGLGGELPYTIRVLFGANEETNMKDVAYYRARHADPAFLFTPDSQFPLGYGESGICSGELVSGALDGDIVEIEGGQAVNAVPGMARAVVLSGEQLEATGKAEVIALDEDRFEVIAHGTSAHASTPELGENAIGILVDYLLGNGVGSQSERAFLELLHDLHETPDGSGLDIACQDEHFGPLTAVGGMIRLVDGHIRQSIDFRYPTTTTATDIARSVQAAAERAGATFAMEHDKEPFLMNPDSPAVRALLDAYQQVTGEDARGLTSKGGTYARCFTTGVSFGPEKPWVESPEWVGGMHGPDEGASEELLKQAFRIYARALVNLQNVEL